MTVVVCADHGMSHPDVDSLSTDVLLVKNLCSEPSWLATADLDDLEALILHAGEFDLGFVQGAIRRAGFNPLGVPVTTLEPAASGVHIAVLIAGLVARHREFDKALPEHAKMQWPKLMSRRRIFALGVPQYIGAPAIDATTCSAERGCSICVDNCPVSALTSVAGGIVHDIETCVACGICVTSCPTGATVNPTATESQIIAQIRAIVGTADGPIGIEYRCREAAPAPLDDGWYPVEVPCVGMLTIGWLLAPLLLGAASVSVPSCRDNGCSIDNHGRATVHLNEASSVLADLDLLPQRLGDHRQVSVCEPLKDIDPRLVTDLHDTSMYLALAAATAELESVVASPTGAVGVVTINDLTCTACEQCVAVCPSAALTSEQRDQTIEISFDSSRCVGCDLCVKTCPERDLDAIAIRHSFDVAELSLGKRTIYSGATSACEVCGGPIAPTAMLLRISSMLGPEHAGTTRLITRRCLKCR